MGDVGGQFCLRLRTLLDRAPSNAAKTDYGCNGGDAFVDPTVFGGPQGPTTYAAGTSAAGQTNWQSIGNTATGVIYAGSQISMASITDGASNTYLLGEKSLNIDAYLNGTDLGDNESAYMGDNGDICRWEAPAIRSLRTRPVSPLGNPTAAPIRAASAWRCATARCGSSAFSLI